MTTNIVNFPGASVRAPEVRGVDVVARGDAPSITVQDEIEGVTETVFRVIADSGNTTFQTGTTMATLSNAVTLDPTGGVFEVHGDVRSNVVRANTVSVNTLAANTVTANVLVDITDFEISGNMSVATGALTAANVITTHLSAQTSGSETPQSSNLIVHYDTTVDTVAAGYFLIDTSGSGEAYNGELYYGASYSSSDRSISFNGANSHVLFNITSASGDWAHTFSCWAKFNSFASNNTMFQGELGGTTASSTMNFRTNTAGKILNAWYGNNQTWSKVLSTGVWYHIVLVYPGGGADQQKLYVDGVEISVSVSGSSTALNVNYTDFALGTYNGLGSSPMDGSMSKPKIWQVALTADEVAAEYALGRVGKTLSLSDTALCLGGLGQTPRAQLDVRGSVKVSGDLVVDGRITGGRLQQYTNPNGIAAAGYSHAILNDQGQVFTVGDANLYKLGVADTTDRDDWTPVAGEVVGKKIVSIKGGYEHYLALAEDGRIYGWGNNGYGQMGNGNTTQPTESISVAATRFNESYKAIAIGCCGYDSYAIAEDGTLWSWGRNNKGQLGLNDLTQREAPVQVTGGSIAGKTVVQVQGGESHVGVTCSDGTLHMCGRGTEGQIGDNSLSSTSVFKEIDCVDGGVKHFMIKVAPGRYHTTALSQQGKVWTWGYNDQGQIGNGSANTTRIQTPYKVAFWWFNNQRFVQVYGGYLSTHAVTENGELYAWGWGAEGLLGDGGTANQAYPTKIYGISGIVAFTHLHWRSSGAILTDGSVWFTGRNDEGQLGNGTTTDSLNYIRVNYASDITYRNFTGQHRCELAVLATEDRKRDLSGLIVVTDQNKYISSDMNTRSNHANSVNDAIPVVALSTTYKDKRVFGVISNSMDLGMEVSEKGVVQSKTNHSDHQLVSLGDTRMQINGLGEGAIWVLQGTGPVEAGDFVVSSNVLPGYAVVQDDDVLHAYTVAKLTSDCDWVNQEVAKERVKRDEAGKVEHDPTTGGIVYEPVMDADTDAQVMEMKYKLRYLDAQGNETDEAHAVHVAALIGCTYHCG